MSKTVLITGASTGFGEDTARTLHAEGHHVFATMRNTGTKSAPVAESLRAAGIEVIELDVTSDASVNAAFKTLFEKTGGTLDVLVNNAGALLVGLSETFSPEQVDALFDVNVIGVHRVMRAALPAMRKAGSGLIINVGSILGRLTIPFVGIYGASKMAVEALTESYRYELSQLGVDVVLVQPGPFATNLYSAPVQPADAERAQEYGDVATLPGEIGKGLGAFLATDTAPKPHEVAKEISKLIQTSPGERTNRVVVGAAFGADAANTALEPLQAQMVHGFGLDKLNTLKTR